MDRKPQRVLYFLALTIFPLAAFFVSSVTTFMVGISVSNPLVTLILVMASVIAFVSTILSAPMFYRAALRQANINIAFLPAAQPYVTEPEEEWSDEDLFGDWRADEDDEDPLIVRMRRKSARKKQTKLNKSVEKEREETVTDKPAEESKKPASSEKDASNED